jgi:hypothetical protein
MNPREWLREQGIEPSEPQPGKPGDVAGSPTGAMPLPPPADQIETQRLPAASPDLPDITTLPTGTLVDTESLDDPLEVEDQPTRAMPGIDLTTTPTRRL